MPVAPPVACIAWHQNNWILELTMPIRRGTAVIVVGIAAILLLAFIFVLPGLINVDRYRPQVISYLQEKTGKQVEIGRLALTFFPVTIHIDRIGVKNPPIFPSGYVARVARIGMRGNESPFRDVEFLEEHKQRRRPHILTFEEEERHLAAATPHIRALAVLIL